DHHSRQDDQKDAGQEARFAGHNDLHSARNSRPYEQHGASCSVQGAQTGKMATTPDHLRITLAIGIYTASSSFGTKCAIWSDRQDMTAPPATSRTMPVIHRAFSDARNSAAVATSSGAPRHLSGCWSAVALC